MAARTGRLFQHPNLNSHISGAGTLSGKGDLIGQRKTRAGGRKPLGDLSNTGKPINQALGGSLKPSKQLKSQNLTTVMNDEAAVSSKARNLESRTTANKASDKSRTGSRKALSDISNSVKPHIPKNSLKPSSLREEPFDPIAIAEEGFLHNHQECLKSQFGAMDVHHFLKTIGLENDSDNDLTISYELPAICKMKSESPHLELEEVPEHMLEVPLFAQPDSPEHRDTQKSSNCYTMWDDFGVNLKLIDSPTKIV